MILCCGEALIDMIPAPTISGRDGYVPHPGGGVFNTAVALGRLDVPVGMLTGLSRDLFSRQLAAALAASNVDASHVVTSARPTSLAFVTLSGGQASYDFFDENSAGRMIEPGDLPGIAAEVSALFFGGISLVSEPAADTYSMLQEREGASRVVMLDPNIRPRFVQDSERYRRRLAAMIARSDILKVSEEDLDWLVPGPAPVRDKVRRIASGGPAIMILTTGARGAVGYLSDGAEVPVPARPVTPVDTVGAGDAFNAGVLSWLWRENQLTKARLRSLRPDALRAALDHGTHVAAISVTRAGANPPWSADL
ncbi:MAG: carbohydrate kinase family protein [Pseudooceanicola sp.]